MPLYNMQTGNRLYRFIPNMRSYMLLDTLTLYIWCCYNKENKKHLQNNKIRQELLKLNTVGEKSLRFYFAKLYCISKRLQRCCHFDWSNTFPCNLNSFGRLFVAFYTQCVTSVLKRVPFSI